MMNDVTTIQITACLNTARCYVTMARILHSSYYLDRARMALNLANKLSNNNVYDINQVA